jgi:hypothetical protein
LLDDVSRQCVTSIDGVIERDEGSQIGTHHAIGPERVIHLELKKPVEEPL